jgi:hypothetical protein
MRLGQLARKLSLRPSQLVDFLAESNIITEEGSNTRLADDHTEMIVRHFAPERLEEITKPATEEIILVESAPIIEEPVQIEETESQNPVALIEESSEDTQPEAEPEVIRVQKIELSGLKVLGKIDLPEPKKKESKAEGETSSGEERPERKGRNPKSKQPRTERDQRTWRNPLEVQRKREARELEERKKAELEREKEKKKNHYQSKVKQVQRPKKDKAVKATVAIKKPDTRPVPKTLLGKFLRWWTT